MVLSSRILRVFALLSCIPSWANALTNGGSVVGMLDPDQSVVHTFVAAAGESASLSLNFSGLMGMEVFAPSGGRVDNGDTIDHIWDLAETGTYSVVITASSLNNNPEGYELHFIKAPGANEHGLLANGGSFSGNLTPQDLDSFTFTASAGDNVQLSVDADSGVDMFLFSPSGGFMIRSQTTLEQYDLAQTGTYTVVVSEDTQFQTQTHSYDLHFIRVPGAGESGSLESGKPRIGDLTRADLDSYVFTATAGDYIRLSASADYSFFYTVYGPGGTFIGQFSGTWQNNQQPLVQGGLYTVVFRGHFPANTGPYSLSLYLAGEPIQSGAGASGADPRKEPCGACSIQQSPKFEGNPVNLALGFKAQPETDYRSGQLGFTRIYRSDSVWTNQDLGAFWRHNYSRRLNFYFEGSQLRAEVVDGRGAVVVFRRTNSGWVALDADYKAEFSEVLDASSVVTGYLFSTPADTREVFDARGSLIRIEPRGGTALDLGYDSAERLVSVTDEEGRALTFSYDPSDRIQSMTTPDGVFSYTYDGSNNLIAVTRPDTTTRTYHYEDATHVNALTGINSAKNIRIATWAYDAQGRAIHSEHAGGVDSHDVSYNPDNSVTVTGPLGKQTVYQFQTVLGVRKITSINRLASPNSPSTTETYTYNSQGQPSKYIDAEGNETRYSYITSRGLESSRTEAWGTPEARTVTTTWESNYRLPNVITEPGRTTDYDYDAFGRVTMKVVTDTATTESRVTTYAYSPNTINSKGDTVLGRLASVDGPRSDVSDITSYTYDAALNLVKITNALGQHTDFAAFDSAGRPLSIADTNGIITTFVYDSMGRLISQTVGARTTDYVYDNAGLLTQVSLPDGRFYTYEYDNAERLTAIQSATGERVEYVLDNAGNHLEEIRRDTTGSVTGRDRQEFDELGRLLTTIETINGVDARTGYSYDGNGNLQTITDPYLQTTAYLYDALQRVTAVTDAESGVIGSGFNALDQLVRVTAPNNAETGFTYNAFGDVIQEDSPDRGTTTYTYDSAGNLSTRSDARGITTTYTYDALNRMTSISYPSPGEDIAFVYDTNPGGPIACTHGTGRLCRMTDESGVTHYAYDPYGNITQRLHTELGVDYLYQFGFDAGDNLTQSVGPDGRVTNYGRDSERRISRVDTTVNGVQKVIVSGIRYHPDGQEVGAVYGNGLIDSRSYDLNGYLQDNSQSLLGDIAPAGSQDGTVNAGDLLMMYRILLDKVEATPRQMINGDLYPPGDPDGILSLQDLILLQRLVVQ